MNYSGTIRNNNSTNHKPATFPNLRSSKQQRNNLPQSDDYEDHTHFQHQNPKGRKTKYRRRYHHPNPNASYNSVNNQSQTTKAITGNFQTQNPRVFVAKNKGNNQPRNSNLSNPTQPRIHRPFTGLGTVNQGADQFPNLTTSKSKYQPINPPTNSRSWVNSSLSQSIAITPSISKTYNHPRPFAKPKPATLANPNAINYLSISSGLPKDILEKSIFRSRLIESYSPVYKNILEYINNSQEHDFSLDLIKVIEITRNGEFPHPPNKHGMLLWHGTKQTHLSPILQQGLKCPPQKGQMFGAGIYFADRVSKSAQYCDSKAVGSFGYLFLCEVLSERCYITTQAIPSATAPPANYNSIMCSGKTIPDPEGNKFTRNSILPLGKSIKNSKYTECKLLFNEYVVFNPKNVNLKYLVKVQFQDKKHVVAPNIKHIYQLQPLSVPKPKPIATLNSVNNYSRISNNVLPLGPSTNFVRRSTTNNNSNNTNMQANFVRNNFKGCNIL